MSGALTIDHLRAELAAAVGAGAGELGDHDNLVDWGLDSIRLMRLVEGWRARGAEVSLSDLVDEPTVAAWADLLRERVADA